MRDDFERDVDEDQGSIDPAAHTRPPPSMRADQESPHHRWSYLGLGDVITLHGPPRPLTECLEQLRALEEPASLAHEPNNTASSDTVDAHPEKRLRTEFGFIPQPAHARTRKPEDAKCPTLLSATLTKHSATFSPLPPGDEPVANMDHYRDAMLLDQFPGVDGQAWYIWAGPEHESYDGSDVVLFAKALRVLELTPDTSQEMQPLKECMKRLTNGRWGTNDFDDEEESEDWKEASGRMRILVYVPLMKHQPTVDLRYAVDSDDNSTIYSTEAGDLIIGTDRYRRDRSSILLSTQFRFEYEQDDGSNLQLTFKYEADAPWMELTLNDGTDVHEVATHPAPREATRRLLHFAELSESELTRARIDYAPTYISPVWPALVAASCKTKPVDHDLWVSLLVRHIGERIRQDLPDADAGDPTAWVWTERQLWHSSQTAVKTVLKAAATELCELAAGIPKHKRFDEILKRTAEEYPTHTPFDENDEDDEEAGEKGEEMEAEASEGGENEGGEGGGEETGAGDGAGSKNIDEDKVERLCQQKAFSFSMSNNARFLEARLATLLPWVSERGFAASFQETMAVAWQNGVQDFFPPYAWHQPTPLDRVSSRLPYALAADPATPEAVAALEEWVVDDRYTELLFQDRSVALREADKDAVMLLGNPAIMAEANIRVHVGPYDSGNESFGSRCGKNLRLTMLNSVYGDLLDDTKGAGFLSLAMVPGKAYSMFAGIEFKLGVWVDEAQNNGSAQRVQPWNPGLILKLATGSESSTFQYRVEHGKEKTVKLKLQALNISSNKINIPDNPGFKSKTEASPYPRLGFSTEEEVEKAKAKGVNAFLIEPSKLDVVKEDPGRLARYFVNRALAIVQNPTEAYPRTPEHIAATDIVLNCSGADELDKQEAEYQLAVKVDEWLHPCNGHSRGSKAAMQDMNEDQVDWPKQFQLGPKRCYCTGKATGTACHFTIGEFATRLEDQDPKLFQYFVKKKNQTAALTVQVQRVLGLGELPPKQANKYPRGSIWGFTIPTLAEGAVEDVDGRANPPPMTPAQLAAREEHQREQDRIDRIEADRRDANLDVRFTASGP